MFSSTWMALREMPEEIVGWPLDLAAGWERTKERLVLERRHEVGDFDGAAPVARAWVVRAELLPEHRLVALHWDGLSVRPKPSKARRQFPFWLSLDQVWAEVQTMMGPLAEVDLLTWTLDELRPWVLGQGGEWAHAGIVGSLWSPKPRNESQITQQAGFWRVARSLAVNLRVEPDEAFRALLRECPLRSYRFSFDAPPWHGSKRRWRAQGRTFLPVAAPARPKCMEEAGVAAVEASLEFGGTTRLLEAYLAARTHARLERAGIGGRPTTRQ